VAAIEFLPGRTCVQLARGMFDVDVADGLTEAALCRQRVGPDANRWIGLGEPLRAKMLRRAAASVTVDSGPDGRGVAPRIAVAVSGVGGVVAAAALGFDAVHGGKFELPAEMTVLSAVVFLGCTSWLLRWRSSRKPMALSRFERAIIQAYVASPPELLPRTNAPLEARLAALAALAAQEVTAGGGSTSEFDRVVCEIYESAFAISRARIALEDGSVPLGTGWLGASGDDLSSAMQMSLESLEGQVSVLCDAACEIRQAGNGGMTAAAVDSLIHELLTRTVIGEFRSPLLPADGA
jgi:hypothetical protein